MHQRLRAAVHHEEPVCGKVCEFAGQLPSTHRQLVHQIDHIRWCASDTERRVRLKALVVIYM